MTNETMNTLPNNINEQLSAMMDGELAGEQVRFLLRSIDAQSDLAKRWSNYHVISATLKREVVALQLPANFADSVLDRLDAGTGSVIAAATRQRRQFAALRWVGGGAIAAAVAVVALVVSRPVGDNGASIGTLPGNNVALTTPQLASPNSSDLLQSARPATRSMPLPGFDARNVQPASLDSILPNYYSPRGDELSRGDLRRNQGPYVLYLTPAQRQALSPQNVQPQSAVSPQ